MKLFIAVLILTGCYLIKSIESVIVLDSNGYTGIVVAISEDVVQPSSDGGLTMITTLQVKDRFSSKNIHQNWFDSYF